jgi:glycosyl transferase family 1
MARRGPRKIPPMPNVLHLVDASLPADNLHSLARLRDDAPIVSIGSAPVGRALSPRMRAEHCTWGCPWLCGKRLGRELPFADQPEVIHAWTLRAASAGWAMSDAGRRAGLVVSLPAAPHARGLARLARKARTGRLSLTLPTQIAYDSAVRAGFPEARVHVLPYPAWPAQGAEVSRAEARRLAGIPQDALVLLSLGIEGNADSHRMARWAHSLLRGIGLDLWCLLPADTPEAARRFSTRFDDDREVRFAPADLAAGGGFATADLATFLPARPGPVGSLCDAMAAGLPIVASRTADVVACVGAKSPTALLVDPDDPRAIAAEALRLLEDAELSESLARRAQRRAQRHHTVEQSRRRLADLYASSA